MFHVNLQVAVSAKADRNTIVLSASVELPFAPFPGLALYGLMDDPEEPVCVESVSYDVIDRVFHCDLEDDQYSSEDEEGGIVPTIEDKVAEYGEAWEVSEPDESDGQEDEE